MMLKDVDAWLTNLVFKYNESDTVIEFLMGLWLFMFLLLAVLVTFPIWVIPYIVIKIKERDTNA